VLSLSGFYLNAQSMWLDSSIQAVTQRDASMFVGEMERVIAQAGRVEIDGSRPGHLALFRVDPNTGTMAQTAAIDWDPGDPHATITTGMDATTRTTVWPATGTLRALKFSATSSDPRLVSLDSLWIDTAAGEPVFLSTSFALYNKP
jgi:hypothetical protein